MNKRSALLSLCAGLALLIYGSCHDLSKSSAVGDEKEQAVDASELSLVGTAEMLGLKTGDFRPVFHMTLNVVDKDRNHGEVEMPSDEEQLRQAITITTGKETDKPFHPCHAFSTGRNQARSVKRQVLLLVDVSGSMNTNTPPGSPDTRFNAAKKAAASLLDGFHLDESQDGHDSIAIVPFESHDVKGIINRAIFAHSKQEAQKQIDGLPAPYPKANTALYSAAVTALEKLQKEKSLELQSTLIILTDGENDVHPEKGDDRDLQDDLNQVIQKARETKIPTYTIGFGAPSPQLKTELTTMAGEAGKYYEAGNLSELRENFKEVQKRLMNQFEIFFFDEGHLDYRNLPALNFSVQFETPTKSKIRGTLPWVCRANTGCAPDDILPSGEQKRAMDCLSKSREATSASTSPWQQILYALGILALFSGGLAFLWLIPPRLIWPGLALPKVADRGPKQNPPVSPKPKPPVPDRTEPSPRPKSRQRFEETRIYDRRRKGSDQPDQ